MQFIYCDPSQLSGPHLEYSGKTSKLHSKRGKDRWSWKKNADYCLAHRVQPTRDEFTKEFLAPSLSISMVSHTLDTCLLPEAKNLRQELQPRLLLLISFSYAVLKKPDLQWNAKDCLHGALNAHAIIDDLVHAGRTLVQATFLFVTSGPFRPYHYRYMTEPSRSYWVQRLKGLNTPFNDESNDVCLVKLLTKLNKSLQHVHTALGYRSTCITCLPESSPADNAVSNVCEPQNGIVFPTETGLSIAGDLNLATSQSLSSTTVLQEPDTVSNCLKPTVKRTKVHAGTHAPDNWLQTFANIDEIDPNDIVDSVLNDWDMQESKNRINSFFRANPSTRTDAALSTYTSTTVSNTGFPYASQQVFIRVSVELPYESEIFSLVQCGDIDGTRALLTSGKTTIDAVDPYGLGLLYYASYYCWRGYGSVVSFNMCKALIEMSANVTWCDEIGNTPEETMLDNILCARAMGHHSSQDMMSAIADIALLFKSDAKHLWTEYVASRGFEEVHEVLLKLNDNVVGLSHSLRSLNANGELPSVINRPDRQGRSPLAWAIEYGWADAARILIEFGADPNQSRHSIKGASPLLHLAVAGPNLGRSREVVRFLLRAGADINAKDHEQWTAVHVVASWGSGDIMVDLIKEQPDLSVVTNTGHSALDLAIDAGADDIMVALLRSPTCYGK